MGAAPFFGRQPKGGRSAVTFHKRILAWQAEHPTVTWIFWIVVWAVVLGLLFWPQQTI